MRFAAHSCRNNLGSVKRNNVGYNKWLATSEDGNKDPPPRGRQKPKFWLWACLAGHTVRMRILPTRGLDSARQVLDPVVGKNGLTVLVRDCYSTCKAFAKQFPNGVALSHC